MASSPNLPATHHALVLHSTSQPPRVETLPTPQPGPGSVVVRVLVAGVISYMADVYNGAPAYPFPTPLVTGTSAIGRIASAGPDATLLSPGKLVLIDSMVRGRDDPTAAFLLGIHEGYTEGSRTLMRGEWKDATYAEYAKVPLENCHVLDEGRLCGDVDEGGLGYSVGDLMLITRLLVPYGGLRDIDLRPGETVIVAPATGSFGGAAVLVALAMGARVLAMGRNVEALRKVAARSERVEAVPITGDVKKDVEALLRFGQADAFFDISPPEAAKSTHLKSGILALRHSGRVSLMGGIREDVPIPHVVIMHRDLVLRGKWMYNREDVAALIKMVEVGVMKLGESAGVKVIGKFALEDWKNAFTMAEEHAGIGDVVLMEP